MLIYENVFKWYNLSSITEQLLPDTEGDSFKSHK